MMEMKEAPVGLAAQGHETEATCNDGQVSVDSVSQPDTKIKKATDFLRMLTDGAPPEAFLELHALDPLSADTEDQNFPVTNLEAAAIWALAQDAEGMNVAVYHDLVSEEDQWGVRRATGSCVVGINVLLRTPTMEARVLAKLHTFKPEPAWVGADNDSISCLWRLQGYTEALWGDESLNAAVKGLEQAFDFAGKWSVSSSASSIPGTHKHNEEEDEEAQEAKTLWVADSRCTLQDFPRYQTKPTCNDALSGAATGGKQTAKAGEGFAFEAIPELVRLSTVTPKPVRWLWPGRIPFGKISILDGDPGLGKSMLSLYVAAKVSTGGAFYKGSEAPRGNVLLINAEDDNADTLTPRLLAYGPDMDKILSLQTVTPTLPNGEKRDKRGIQLPNDLPMVRRVIEEFDVKLLVIDPLMAVLNGKVDSFKDQSVRTDLMAPLKTLAEETGCAVLIVRHLNKGSSENALYRGGGSIGIIGAARSGLMVARNPENPEERVLAVVKSNLSKEAPSLRFKIVEQTVSGQTVPKIEFTGESDATAQTLATGENYSADRRAILTVLHESNGPLSLKQVAQQVDKTTPATRNLLKKLVDSGEVMQPKYGLYALAFKIKMHTLPTPPIEKSSESDECSECDESDESDESWPFK